MGTDRIQELFYLTTGKYPRDDPERWSVFATAIARLERDASVAAIVDTSIAIAGYSPIDPDDMQPAYGRAFKATRSACVRLCNERIHVLHRGS